jgi:outer membrane protein OmpA-like peptidoglycan-associated protein
MRTLTKYLMLASLLLMSVGMSAQTPDAELQTVLQKLDRGESVEHILINLGDINFATATASLEPGAKTYLDQVAKLLRSVPNMNLMIKGHADNTGSATANEKLSSDRATAVRNYLIMQNIAAIRLKAQGFGSSLPVAENTTSDGRAKNRRVELEILKIETVKALQDIIVLRNGERVGAIVRNYDMSQITYRQFSDAAEQKVATVRVEKIIFADGREVRFDLPATAQKPTENKPKRKFSFRPFAESESFHPGQFVLGLGLGVENNVGIKYRDSKVSLPPVWAVLELPLKHNVGVGLSGGAMMWQPKQSDGNSELIYYSFAPRVAYHFNLGPKVDLYTGLAITARFVNLEVEREGMTSISITNNRIDAGLFSGIRYYFNNTLGLYGELGRDNVACARIGISLRFGR